MQFFKNKFFIALFLSIILLLPFSSEAKTEHQIHFKNTDYELHVFKTYGTEKGKTLMIIGGIQGDEPGGYLAADLYADIDLKKGNLIVVPRANFLSIIRNKRVINRDMNRRFSKKDVKKYYEDKVVKILEKLIAQSDYLLNLHEGSGFYSEQWESKLINPMKYGQSIIADADVYDTEDGREIHLGNMARRVAEKVNEGIEEKKHHFKFNDHKTFMGDTKHAEQRRSATYFALFRHNIPAFGIETSKEIRDIEKKVKYQRMIINAFMEETGIIPESPRVSLASPRLNYLLVSLNGDKTLAYNGEKVRVRKGDRVKVIGINANYDRGLSVDFLELGSANDTEKEFTISKAVRVIVRKDNLKCGEVEFVPDTILKVSNGKSKSRISSQAPFFRYLIIENNGVRHVMKNGDHLKVVRGDFLKVTDLVGDLLPEAQVKVNFLGFVGNKQYNSGEDRGYTINTAGDLWTRYSEGSRGKNYRIKITSGASTIGSVYVDIEEPELDYIVVKHNNGDKQWYTVNDVIKLPLIESFEVVDVKTNVAGNSRVKLYMVSNLQKGGMLEKSIDLGVAIPEAYYGETKSGGYSLVVKRGNIVLGKTAVKVGESFASLEME